MIQGNAEHTVELLNNLLIRDPKWVKQLFGFHPRCNLDLANHPEVQCRTVGSQFFSCGVLGLLNGLHGTFDEGPKAGYGPVTAIYDDKDNIVRFEVTQNA